MHAQFDAFLAIGNGSFGDAQQLDAITQLLGVFDVSRAEFGDAFDVGFVKLHWNAEGDGRHQCDFVRGVHSFDVEGRVGFGVTQSLRLFQDGAKVQPFVAHLGQDEVGRAIDDAGNPLDAVGRQALTQGLDDGNATGHSGLKRHHHAPGMGRRKNFGAVHGQQGLVGGDHVFAGGYRFHHQLFGDAITADEFDDDVDVRVGNDGARIADHADIRADRRAGSGQIQISHHGDFNATPGAALDLRLVAF